jgi:hypothetical protein
MPKPFHVQMQINLTYPGNKSNRFHRDHDQPWFSLGISCLFYRSSVLRFYVPWSNDWPV